MTIYEMLEEKVNDIFVSEQEKRGIEYGDCDPLMSCELDDAIEKNGNSYRKDIAISADIKIRVG